MRPARVQHVRGRLGANLQSEALWSSLPQPELPTFFFFSNNLLNYLPEYDWKEFPLSCDSSAASVHRYVFFF